MMPHRRLLIRSALVVTMALLGHLATLPLCHSVCAQVPRLIRYQGQAVDSAGVPLEGPNTLTFRLYDAATGGNEVWEEQHTGVQFSDGHFSVLLGSVTPMAGMNWEQPCWLAVQVNGESELAPRQQITSVPAAMTAERLADSNQISPVNLLKNGSFEMWWEEGPYPVLRDWQTWTTGGYAGVIGKATDVVSVGRTAVALRYDGQGHNGNVGQEIDGVNQLRGKPVTCSVWAYASHPDRLMFDLEVHDSVTSSYRSRLRLAGGTWELFTITHVVSPQATTLKFFIGQVPDANPSTDQIIYLDGAMAVAGPMPFAFSPHPQDALGAITSDGTNVGIGISTPGNVLTIPPGSATDPIADAWLIHPSDRKHKDLLGSASTGAHLKRMNALPVYEWKRKPLVSDEEVERHLGRAEATASEREAKRRELAAWKATLPKYTAKRVGIAIDDPDVPQEILAFNADGTPAGIDLAAYIGYLHVALKEAALRIEALEARLPGPTPPPRGGNVGIGTTSP